MTVLTPWEAPPTSFFSSHLAASLEAVVAATSDSESLPATETVAYLPIPSSQQTQTMVLAQQFDQDILGDMGNLWNTFIDSGQVWALLIGFVLGYLLRGITAY